MGLSFDTSFDPLHLQVFAGRFAYADVNAHFDELESYYARMVKARPDWRPCLFADMRSAGKIDALGRRRVTECFERLAPVLGSRMVAHAVVVPGKVGSGVLTAILWVQQPPWPIQVFSNADDARGWIVKRYTEARLPVPAQFPAWWERARKPPPKESRGAP